MILLSAGFFFVLHQVFQGQTTTQFTNFTESTYCDQQLHQVAFELLIDSCIGSVALVIFGVVFYEIKT